MSNWASFFLKIWHDFFGKGILEGKVIDEKEQPLQQAIIRLNNKEEAATSIQGTFLFENLRGKYTISIVFQNIIIENYDTIFIKGGDEKKIEIKLLQKYFPLPSAPPPSSENPIENPNQPLEQTTDTVTLPINPPPPSIDDSASEMEEAFYDEESFVTRLSSFSDKKWTEYYFELAEQIVNFNEIAHNAPMLAMTVPQKKKLPVSIGSRYILCLGEKKKKNDEKLLYIGFIVDGEGAVCDRIVVAGEKRVYKNVDGGKGNVDGVCKRTKRSGAEEDDATAQHGIERVGRTRRNLGRNAVFVASRSPSQGYVVAGRRHNPPRLDKQGQIRRCVGNRSAQ